MAVRLGLLAALLIVWLPVRAAVLMAVSLPRRAMVTEIAIGATVQRDMSADVAAAMTKRAIS